MHNPEKKHSGSKRDNRSEGAPVKQISVQGVVAEGTHRPMVRITFGETALTIPINDALEMGSIIFQCAGLAYQDALLVRFFEATGQDKLQAWQTMTTFQQFRERDQRVQAELALAVTQQAIQQAAAHQSNESAEAGDGAAQTQADQD